MEILKVKDGAAGISGWDYDGSNTLTERCYNSGTIYSMDISNSFPVELGGLIAGGSVDSNIKESYNCGKIIGAGTKFAVSGYTVQENCYYLKDDDIIADINENAQQINTKYNSLVEFLEALDAGNIN